MSGAPFDDRPGAWPAGPGSYLVVLRLPASRRLQIGRLGRARFPAGLWLYVGSARGPGGLPARLLRHWRGGTRRHWHIDYLRHAAQPVAAAWISGQEDVECRWAGRLASADGFEAGPAGFGASDCRCQTHLSGRRRRAGRWPRSPAGWPIWCRTMAGSRRLPRPDPGRTPTTRIPGEIRTWQKRATYWASRWRPAGRIR